MDSRMLMEALLSSVGFTYDLNLTNSLQKRGGGGPSVKTRTVSCLCKKCITYKSTLSCIHIIISICLLGFLQKTKSVEQLLRFTRLQTWMRH